MGYMQDCPACGNSYGSGKGVFGLGRHSCDEYACYLLKFFNAGVDLQTCARALDIGIDKAELLLRAKTRKVL